MSIHAPSVAEVNLAPEIAAALRSAVGAAHVWTDEAGLAEYSRCTIPWDRRCGAVVFPESAQQVADVLRIANEFGEEVWPYSGGRNWGYGATLTIRPGAIVMILERMKRIEVDDTLAYAVVEPGVTYSELSEYLRKNGDRLWPDCIDGTPNGSVIGNALDRGIGETPYGDHFGNLCGLEVVLPSGEVIRTGSPRAEARTHHLHKWGIGPYVEGLFSQSNFGVVTRAGIWLMPKPECFNSFVFELHDERNFERVVDAFRCLALQGVLTSKLHMINDFVSMTIVTQRICENVDQDAPLSDDDRQALRHKYRIALWSCAGGLYGSRRSVAVQRRALRQALRGLGRLVFVSDAKMQFLEGRLIPLARKYAVVRILAEVALRASLPVIDSFPHVHRILKGIPTDYFLKHAYYRHKRPRPASNVNPARDRCGLIWFAPILPNLGVEIREYIAASRAIFRKFGFDFYVALLTMNPRAVVCLMNINYDRDSDSESKNAKDLYEDLLFAMHRSGYEQYRSALLDWIAPGREQGGTKGMLDLLKQSLDPRGIVAPGRYGIGGDRGVAVSEDSTLPPRA